MLSSQEMVYSLIKWNGVTEKKLTCLFSDTCKLHLPPIQLWLSQIFSERRYFHFERNKQEGRRHLPLLTEINMTLCAESTVDRERV